MSNPSDSGGAGVSPKLPKMSNGSSNSMHEMAVLSSCKASDFTVGQVRAAMLTMLTLCFTYVYCADGVAFHVLAPGPGCWPNGHGGACEVHQGWSPTA